MNVVKLMGGLGNQLFQYMFGQVQAENGIDVAYDVSWFKNTPRTNTLRPYLMDKFPVKIKKANFLNQQSIHETVYDPTMLIVENCNFFGYWQYTSYYDSILSRLQAELIVDSKFYTPEYLALKSAVENASITALHVRRGDYLTTTGFTTLPLRYYFEALHQIKGAVFIFSDDLAWCKEKFKPQFFDREITFVDLPDYLTFDLMRQCSNFIIANSSFSTLAAYLSKSEDKKVIYPKQWMTPVESQRDREKKNNLPNTWMEL